MEFGKEELIAVILTLSSAIFVLWTVIRAWTKREQIRLTKCEEMHAEGTKQLTDLTAKYHYLQGRMDGVEKLSVSVLDKITDHNKK